MLVGRTRQRYHGAAFEHKVLHLDHVAHGVDRRIIGAHVFVHDDPSAFIELKPCVPCKRAVRPHADGQDHQIRRDFRAAFQGDDHLLALLFEAVHAVGKVQLHAVAADVLVEHLRHLKVNRRHDLIESFDKRHLKARVMQVLRHLEADEPAADHRRGPQRTALHHGADLVRVGHGPQCFDPRGIDAGDARTQRRRTGCDHQIVVGLLVRFTGLGFSDGDRLLHAVDLRYFVLHAHVDAEPFPHALRRHQEEHTPVFDHVAHMVRQAAVCIRNIRAAFQDHDLAVRVQSSQSGCAACAAGNAADDDGFSLFAHGHLLIIVSSFPAQRAA